MERERDVRERERGVGAGESSHSETGSMHTPSTRTLDRSDAESVATTVSQDSNKENTRPEHDIQLRRKKEYNKVCLLATIVRNFFFPTVNLCFIEFLEVINKFIYTCKQRASFFVQISFLEEC